MMRITTVQEFHRIVTRPFLDWMVTKQLQVFRGKNKKTWGIILAIAGRHQ